VSSTPTENAAGAHARAQRFVAEDAGFAQVVTIDAAGFPVGRSMTAFLNADWSVDLVQRRSHARLIQLTREPRLLVSWVGAPAPGATNEHPHVFDLGRLPDRVVLIRGTAEFMPVDWTVERYLHHVGVQRARGLTRAPLRTPDQVGTDLVGVHVHPHRVRLEGFATGAQSIDWTVRLPDQIPPSTGGTR